MNFMPSYLDIAFIRECTVRPNIRSPHKPMVRLSRRPFSLLIVRRSARVWVGWLCPPSPALMIGTSDFIEASIGAPSFGCLMAMISA